MECWPVICTRAAVISHAASVCVLSCDNETRYTTSQNLYTTVWTIDRLTSPVLDGKTCTGLGTCPLVASVAIS
eukprot:6471076-Amphidinium_carterae.1